MTPDTSKVVQVPVDSLGSFYLSIASTLSEAGFNGARLNEIFTSSFSAECARCGMEVTAEEIGQIAITDDYKQLPHPKLQRLRLGCCARDGCEAYIYSVRLQNHREVDWVTIAENAVSALIAKSAAAQEAKRRQKNRQRYLHHLRVALASVLGLVLLLSWFMAQHNRLPFTKKHQKYQIDPASVGEDVGR